MYILGVWDGHDSGAALIRDNKIVFASNEERYTRRKLEVAFPYNAINAALKHEGIRKEDIEVVAFPTTEFTKTMSRIFPIQKESYYRFRRRKMQKPAAESLRHYAKYSLTSIGPTPFSEAISKHLVSRELRKMGFKNFKIQPIDHHAAHAATAAFTSGMKNQLVITLDGIGDGLSGTVSTLQNGVLKREAAIPGRDSIGIFFEQVTNILGMRELEDEGKIMAMADYSFPFPFSENRLADFFTVDGVSIKAKHGPVTQYRLLSKMAWSMPREQLAYMAQQVLENTVSQFVSNSIDEYGMGNVSFAGGVMSNIKANMKVRYLGNLKHWYIFPHMGDGGIALGAAMHANYMLHGTSNYAFRDAYLGEEYDDAFVEQKLREQQGISFHIDKKKASHAADIIEDDDYLFWFNGRMEFGPRSLGNRSILASSSSDTVKERLNTYVKQREWYQPFAPSILNEDAKKLLEDVNEQDRFMTMGYRARKSASDVMKSVVHVDMTARPHMVGEENREYRDLLKAIRKKTGYGIVLNTSFNIHGMPIVCSPEDALYTLKKTRSRYLFIGNYFVENKNGAKR